VVAFVLCVCAPPFAVGSPGALSMSGTPAAGRGRPCVGALCRGWTEFACLSGGFFGLLPAC